MRDELVKWLLAEGFAEQEPGFGHVTANELADDLLKRYEVKRKDLPTDVAYEVLDSYDIPVFTGTLMECGGWIDPLFGIDFDRSIWGDTEGEDGEFEGIDDDRFECQDDGSIVVKLDEGPGGIGGEMIIRPVS
jgi:hypothetical protein